MDTEIGFTDALQRVFREVFAALQDSAKVVRSAA